MNGAEAVEFYKTFKKHNFTEKEAKAVAGAIGGMEYVRRDINWLKWIMAGMVAVLISFAGILFSLKEDIGKLKAEIEGMKANQREFRAEMRSEIKGLRTEMRSEIKALRTEMKSMKADIIKEMKALLIKK